MLVRSGEVYYSKLGLHGSYEQWVNRQARQTCLRKSARILRRSLSSTNPCLCLKAEQRELSFLEKRARASNIALENLIVSRLVTIIDTDLI